MARVSASPDRQLGRATRQVVEDVFEVAVDEPMAAIRKSMQRGVRDFVGLIGTALDENIAVEIAVPNVHGGCDIAEAKSPWLRSNVRSCIAARPAVEARGRPRSSRTAAW